MNSAHKSMHDHHEEQQAHHGQPHSHGHSHGHAHISPSVYDKDDGIKMMRRLAMLQRHGMHNSWMNDYRNTRIIPVSNIVFAAAVGVVLIGIALVYALPQNLSLVGLAVASVAAIYLLVISGFGLIMTLFMRRERAALRKTVFESIPMHGNEQVLDVACGSGVLLNGLARRLTTGKALGIDIYQPNSGGTSLATLRRNIKAEGVEDRVSFQEMDARHLQFEDSRFNVVVSSLALHHIGSSRQEIEQAVIEMVRVLKTGGYISLVDLAPMIDIAEDALQRAGLKFTTQTRSKYFKFVTAQKI